jgi:uncharacterized protein (TIGR03546 family)
VLLIAKILKGVLKAIASNAARWQIALGAAFGILLGLLPLFPGMHGPSPLGWLLVAIVIVINCHFGSVLAWMFFGIGLAKLLPGPATALGQACDGLARWAADVPFLYHSQWSDQRWLGLTLIGFILAPLVAALMWWFTGWFRAKLLRQLAERRALVLAGKAVGNPIGFKIACWFFGL